MSIQSQLFDFCRKLQPAALEMLREMVAINSFTGNREGVCRLAEYTADCFAPLGFQAEKVPAINSEFGDHLFISPVR